MAAEVESQRAPAETTAAVAGAAAEAEASARCSVSLRWDAKDVGLANLAG